MHPQWQVSPDAVLYYKDSIFLYIDLFVIIKQFQWYLSEIEGILNLNCVLPRYFQIFIPR